jgi:hypothetical protein
LNNTTAEAEELRRDAPERMFSYRGREERRVADFSGLMMSLTIIPQIPENKQYFFADFRKFAFIWGERRL